MECIGGCNANRKPKAAHLGPQYAAQFQDASVVAAYSYRPPVPDEVFDVLLGLIKDSPRAVLDIGCGRGEIARRLVDHVDPVDAVDWSRAMIDAGRELPSGNHPSLHWIWAKAETAPLRPPYALVSAGSSLHWMDWDVVLPRLALALTLGGQLAIVDVASRAAPWDDELKGLIRMFSTNQDYRPYDLVAELEERGLFVRVGQCHTTPSLFNQRLEDYVESIHSRNGFSRERMTAQNACEFDRRVRDLVGRYTLDGQLTLEVVASVTWGRPGYGDGAGRDA